MNEWKCLLEQSHSSFQNLMTVEQAIHQETAPEDQELSPKVQSHGPGAESHGNEIEWISPTGQLQDKIQKIPDKLGFKIGEAADYVGVKQHVLRYWESEFDQLKPQKSKKGQRMYAKKDVEMALMIKKLLHDDRFSIDGAKSALKRLRRQIKEKPPTKVEAIQGKALVPPKENSLRVRGEAVGSSLEFAQLMLNNIREARWNLNL